MKYWETRPKNRNMIRCEKQQLPQDTHFLEMDNSNREVHFLMDNNSKIHIEKIIKGMIRVILNTIMRQDKLSKEILIRVIITNNRSTMIHPITFIAINSSKILIPNSWIKLLKNLSTMYIKNKNRLSKDLNSPPNSNITIRDKIIMTNIIIQIADNTKTRPTDIQILIEMHNKAVHNIKTDLLIISQNITNGTNKMMKASNFTNKKWKNIKGKNLENNKNMNSGGNKEKINLLKKSKKKLKI